MLKNVTEFLALWSILKAERTYSFRAKRGDALIELIHFEYFTHFYLYAECGSPLCMLKKSCTTCAKSNATLTCGCCQVDLCKNCAQFLEPDSFSFLTKVPVELSHAVYCMTCYVQTVEPQLGSYQATLEQAKNVFVFNKKQGKETRLIRRIEKPVFVSNCADYEETVLRLAFFATQANCNAIVDVDVVGEKIRKGSYQTTIWSGSAVPANVQGDRLVKDSSIWQNPN